MDEHNILINQSKVEHQILYGKLNQQHFALFSYKTNRFRVFMVLYSTESIQQNYQTIEEGKKQLLTVV